MNPFESLMRQLTASEPTEKNFKPIKKQMHAVLEHYQNAEKFLSFALHQGAPNEQVQALKKQVEQDLEDMGTEALSMACGLYGLEPEPSNYRTLSLLLLRRIVGEPPPTRTKWTIDESARLERDFHRALEDGAKTQLDAWKQLARDPHWQKMASDIRHSEPENQRNRPEQTLTLARTLRSQHIRSKREYEKLLAQVNRRANQMRGDKGK
jgi:hypothetical protein